MCVLGGTLLQVYRVLGGAGVYAGMSGEAWQPDTAEGQSCRSRFDLSWMYDLS